MNGVDVTDQIPDLSNVPEQGPPFGGEYAWLLLEDGGENLFDEAQGQVVSAPPPGFITTVSSSTLLRGTPKQWEICAKDGGLGALQEHILRLDRWVGWDYFVSVRAVPDEGHSHASAARAAGASRKKKAALTRLAGGVEESEVREAEGVALSRAARAWTNYRREWALLVLGSKDAARKGKPRGRKTSSGKAEQSEEDFVKVLALRVQELGGALERLSTACDEFRSGNTTPANGSGRSSTRSWAKVRSHPL
jgi:hypothetical protein